MASQKELGRNAGYDSPAAAGDGAVGTATRDERVDCSLLNTVVVAVVVGSDDVVVVVDAGDPIVAVALIRRGPLPMAAAAPDRCMGPPPSPSSLTDFAAAADGAADGASWSVALTPRRRNSAATAP